MERKTKRELLSVIEEQNKTLSKYKSRLHDIIESYKHLMKEKEALELSVKSLTDTSEKVKDDDSLEHEVKGGGGDTKDNDTLQNLKLSLVALTNEKSRIEGELRVDRRKIIQEKEDLERKVVENENSFYLEREKLEKQVQDMRRKINIQQREREREQQDHSVMLKELQNVLASERAVREKLEQQIVELQRVFEKSSIPEKKVIEYENLNEKLRHNLRECEEKLRTSVEESLQNAFVLQTLQEEMGELKLQFHSRVEEERNRADNAEDKLRLLTLVKEKRIASLETRISELADMVSSYDRMKQEDQTSIQKLKEKITQMHAENNATSRASSNDESVVWGTDANVKTLQNKMKQLKTTAKKQDVGEDIHAQCRAEIVQLKEEVEQYKTQAEAALKDKYNKTSAALISDAKEIKELKSRVTQLTDQLQSSRSQVKLSEEYHNKIVTNLEKSIDEIKLQSKHDLAQSEATHRSQIMDLEHQIQKQRERTLSLLEEKDKEISQLKSSFLFSFTKKGSMDSQSSKDNVFDDTVETDVSDQEAAMNLLPHSLISSKRDGRLLYYVQELARKDVEISNLRRSRLQTESTLRSLQQTTAIAEDKYSHEIESLKSRIKLLESSEKRDGMNIEYLKNVILRFLKCNDPRTRQHMVNAIATVLHFTSCEVQEVKSYLNT